MRFLLISDTHGKLAFINELAAKVGAEAVIHAGVNLGLLPTKGLTLPLMSYGGNSIIVSCLVIAMLLRIHWENRVEERGGGPSWQGA